MVTRDHDKNSPFNGEFLSWESKIRILNKRNDKIMMKCIILRNGPFKVETVGTIARKRDKAIRCFKTTKLQLKDA